MNLWVFGCSFSVGSKFHNNKLWKYPENWIDIVAKNLGITNVNNFAQFGVSNEFIFKSFGENFGNFRSGDYVLIQTTSPIRKWFFEDHPNHSNITNMRSGTFSSAEESALKSYLTVLQNDNFDDILYTQFLYAVSYFIINKPTVKFLILPGFGDAPNVDGNLAKIGEHEFDSESTLNKFYDTHHWDPRLNHMTYNNHQILAQKVTEYLLNKDNTIDLINGFENNLYNKDYIGEDNEYNN
jgi:hypothetical protein